MQCNAQNDKLCVYLFVILFFFINILIYNACDVDDDVDVDV